MEEIVWSSGEKCEKTKKKNKPLLNDKNEIIHNIPYRSEYNIRKNNKLDGKRASEIMDRQMFAQTCQNPFLNKNYTDVLSDQDKFMKPQNSSIQNE
jgi:hypothetical protein